MATHGMRKTRIYETWVNMKTRCTNKNNAAYPKYGGRGILLCAEWTDDFLSFYKWALSHGYSDRLTIDRINNNGNYEPNNCRFVSYVVQNNNRRSNHILTYNGKSQALTAWSRETGIPQATISNRLKKGWTIDEVFNIPHKPGNNDLTRLRHGSI